MLTFSGAFLWHTTRLSRLHHLHCNTGEKRQPAVAASHRFPLRSTVVSFVVSRAVFPTAVPPSRHTKFHLETMQGLTMSTAIWNKPEIIKHKITLKKYCVWNWERRASRELHNFWSSYNLRDHQYLCIISTILGKNITVLCWLAKDFFPTVTLPSFIIVYSCHTSVSTPCAIRHRGCVPLAIWQNNQQRDF